MKHLKLIVTLVVITMVVVSLGVAGKATGVTSPGLGTMKAASVIGPIVNDEGRTGKGTSARVRAAINNNPKAARPIPAMDKTVSVVGLSGLYHIPGDFATIGNAVAVLNFVGLAGNATFELDAASYTENALTFGAYAGNTFTLTVQPDTGLAVTINFVTTATEGKGFAFNGAKNISVNGTGNAGSSLSLQYSGAVAFPASDAFAATVYVTNGSDAISVSNCTINGEFDNTFALQTDGRPAVFVWRGATDAAGNSNITIDHCTIINATYAIKVLNDLSISGSLNGPINYTYNNVGTFYGGTVGHGGVMDQVTGMHYDHNNINGVEFIPYYWENGPTEYDGVTTFADPSFSFDFGQPSAGHFYNCGQGGSTVSYNTVDNAVQVYNDPGFGFIVYGLLVRVGGAVNVHHNRITGVNTTDADGTIAGLRSEAQAFHNSVRLTGAILATQTSYPMRAAGGTTKNNAFSNEQTGAAASKIRALQGTPAGVSNGNAMYSAGQISTQATLASYLATGQDANSVFGPVGFDATLHLALAGPSSAENIGLPFISTAVDIDTTITDTTFAGTRDAGADEVTAALGVAAAVDVLPTLISPPPASVPFGLAQTPSVTVKNNTGVATGSFTVTLSASVGPYTSTKSFSIAPMASQTVAFDPWTPAALGVTVLTATSNLVDAIAGNNILTKSVTAVAPTVIAATKTYTFDAGAEGWVGSTGPTATTDWLRSSTFTKLTGPYAGSSWVTRRPAPAGPASDDTYTEGARANTQGYTVTYPGANILTSPFVDLSTMVGPDVYIGFYHSDFAEAGWDRSWMEYTTDGLNWTRIGVVNEGNGVNWYNEAVYANAVSVDGFIDTATANDLYHLNFHTGDASWSSNGDINTGTPTGPIGYVYSQYHFDATHNPSVVHAPVVAFRYVAFSDAATAFVGWAFDNFTITSAAPVFTGGTINGKSFEDVNGNGVFDGGDIADASRKIYRAYFGVPVDTATTDINGDYSFTVGLPGIYNLTNNHATIAWTVPAGITGKKDINHPSTGGTITQNFGFYNGSISGIKFSDTNDDGVKDGGEPGKAGWTVEVHKDSLNGVLWGSNVSSVTGAYSVPVIPGTWYVKEIAQASARKTLPAAAGYSGVVVGGASGSGTAIVSGYDFGNFFFATLRVEASIDVFGDGSKDIADHTSLPALVTQTYNVRKNGVLIFTDVVGNTITSIVHAGLDTGNYSVARITTTPAGWLKTSVPDSFNFSVFTSGHVDTANTLFFKLVTASGHKFNDLNGNGALDGGDLGIAAWPIVISGTGGGTVLTDVNGDWSIATLAGGSHTISEDAAYMTTNGWTQTYAASGLVFTAQSGNLPGANKTGRDFGNYKNVCISGLKYRDRNNNGAQDAGEEGLSGWTININPGGYSVVTDANGNWTICSILPTTPTPDTVTITETSQAGWALTQPALGSYVVVLHSGDVLTGYKFGNFKGSDTTKFRTYTATQMGLAGNAKPNKKPSVKKPTTPNLGNLINDIFVQTLGSLQVGLSGQLNAGGKEKAYVLGAKQGDVFKTFNNKTITHSNPARGLDFDNLAKPLLKRFKNLPATKKNDLLLANMLTLKINIVASGIKTPAGLGTLKYSDAGHPLNGKTISQIASSCDTLMTNWEGVPFTTYAMYDSVIAKINAAFSDGAGTYAYDSASWWSAGKFKVRNDQGYKTVYEISFLIANPGAAPTQTPTEPSVVLPTVFALQQNYPNPFNPTTSIAFDVPEASIVTLKIYNMLGQEVATLLDRQVYDGATSDDVEFDASSLASGVYLYRIVATSINDDGLETGNTFTQVKKMLLVK